MGNFKTIYIILSALEKALDSGFDENDISPERLGISERRRDALLEMMQGEGYITGAIFTEFAGGMRGINIDGIRITLKGLEYLENNGMMQKAYRALKGLKEITPGL